VLLGWLGYGRTFIVQGGDADHARIVLSVMDWHISTTACVIGIGEELAHKVLQCESTLLEYTGFAVLCKDYIVWCQCCGGSDCDAFFARGNLQVAGQMSPCPSYLTN